MSLRGLSPEAISSITGKLLLKGTLRLRSLSLAPLSAINHDSMESYYAVNE